MPSEKKTRDRPREKEKDRKIRDATNDRLEKSYSDKSKDKKSSSRSKDSSRSTREKDRDREKKKEQRDIGDKKEEKERHKKKEEKVTSNLNHESERKSLKQHNNDENEKRRSSIKQHRTEIVTEDSDISEENIKQENVTTTKTVNEDDFDYEDDEFEDYDEDFEDDDEEDEEEEESDGIAHTESKLDSGNYDLQSSRQTSVRMQRELEAVKEAMVRENMGPKSSKQTSEMSGDSGRESPEVRQTKREEPRKQSGFINFSAAKERNKVQIAAKAANSRGADLQKMIRLDIVNFDLLDLPPIRYPPKLKFKKKNIL